jgi:hypothetical protein
MTQGLDARSVAAELEEIFGPERGGPRGDDPHGVRPAAAGPRRRLSLAAGGLLAAVMLGGLSALVLAWPGASRAPTSSAEVQLAAAAPIIEAPAPEPLTVKVTETRFDGFPYAPEPYTPVFLDARTTPAASPVKAAPAIVVQRAAKPKRAERPIRTAARKPPPIGGRTSSSEASRCGRYEGPAYDRCAYPAVLDADRRLRSAYAEATRAGVPRDVLVDYRQRWTSLRRLGPDEPNRIIRGYGALERDLERMAHLERARRGA